VSIALSWRLITVSPSHISYSNQRQSLPHATRFGEIVDVNLPRDRETGKPRGFAFIMYEDQRSTVLAVDNMNGGKVLGRTVRVSR
jgi:hypothetical protein